MHDKMKVQIVNKSAYPTPAYATEKSAGMDLKANITEPLTLGPLERAMVPTGLFIALPIGVVAIVEWLFGLGGIAIPGAISSILEGVTKVGIFLGYLALVSLMPDIKRTFMYHGAEHKSIAFFEAGDELTPENAMKHTRFHPRCGTSFLLIIMCLSIVIMMVVRFDSRLINFVVRIALIPVIAGISYEFLRLAGKYDNSFMNFLSKKTLVLSLCASFFINILLSGAVYVAEN